MRPTHEPGVQRSVDKCELLRIFAGMRTPVLLCRPPGFGKTHTLAILGRELHLDPHAHVLMLSGQRAAYPDLRAALSAKIKEYLSVYEPMSQLEADDPASLLRSLLTYISADRYVAILIDDYDSSLMQALAEDADVRDHVQVWREIWDVVDGFHNLLHPVVLAGIMPPSFWCEEGERLMDGVDVNPEILSGICGYTPQEARAAGIDTPADISLRAGGYHTAQGEELLHPAIVRGEEPDGISVILRAIKRLWREHPLPLGADVRLPASVLHSHCRDAQALLPLLVHVGALCVQTDCSGFLTLKTPNLNADRLLLRSLPAPGKSDGALWDISRLRRALAEGDPDTFLRLMQSLLAAVPYFLVHEGESERLYHILIFLISALSGHDCMCEYVTSRGRIDMLAQTSKYIYIFEFKFREDSQKAMAQISDRGYTLPFQADHREIIAIGVNFSSTTRTISDWTIEKQQR